MKKVLLFSGKAEHGKTLAGTFMQGILEDEGWKVLRLAYADYLKFVAKKYFGWNGKKDEDGRRILQELGTDIIRKKYPQFWADTVAKLVWVLADEFDYAIIDDCRFPDEVTIWQNYDIDNLLVRVIRPDHVSKLTQEQLQHPSETSLDGYPYGYRLIARDYDELEEEVKDLRELI